MVRMLRFRWLRSIAVSLIICLAVVGLGPPWAAAQQAQQAHLDALAAALKQASRGIYDRSAKGYLEQAVSLIRQVEGSSGDIVPDSVLLDLEEHIPTLYLDGTRTEDPSPLHSMQRVSHSIATQWEEQNISDPVALDALMNLVVAVRQTSEIWAEDLRHILRPVDDELAELPPMDGITPEAWSQAIAAYESARQHLSDATYSLLDSDLLEANSAFFQAWEDGLSGLRFLASPPRPTPLLTQTATAFRTFWNSGPERAPCSATPTAMD